jgi:hypothetical protein
MWPTDEYAINDLTSGWRIQINLVATAPHNEILISIDEFNIHNFGNNWIIRANPYPPNFSKIAAKIIDPAIGASTWAFGNHKWTENIGNFTKNPAKIKVQKNGRDIDTGNIISYIIVILGVLE